MYDVGMRSPSAAVRTGVVGRCSVAGDDAGAGEGTGDGLAAGAATVSTSVEAIQPALSPDLTFRQVRPSPSLFGPTTSRMSPSLTRAMASEEVVASARM